ncbi:MAG: hypothetical protein MUF84_15550 [Anaerolineae bacterium]|nr:hypothetical protein [Anaerolineae bacterium]
MALPVGFYPFWFWNDRLSADEIRWQVHEMATQGVRGFFIHSRQGLEQPYLSESFFEMVDVALAAAKAEGLVVHLYDEYPYPSGVAGGEVILGNPQLRATRLVQRTYDLQGGSVRVELPRGKVLSCMAFPLRDGGMAWDGGQDLRKYLGMVLARNSYNEMGLTQYNRKRYFASEPTPVLETMLPQGEYRLLVSVQIEVTHHKYWDAYVDALNPEAIARFIALTHERYLARYGGDFGDAIHSIFVDEIAPAWSDRLPEAFEAACGYSLADALPALQDTSHPDHARVSYDYGRVRYGCFCDAFERPVASWCRAHGLAYSGEKPSVRLSQLRWMDIPGCEPGHTKAGAQPDWMQARVRSNAKATASAAYFYGKEGALCECYHSTGWSATLQDAKLIADGLLLAGIRYLVPHGFFYTTHALKKHDAPPTFFFQMPSWPFFGQLSAHVERVAQAFEGTHIDAEILVVDPGSGLPTHEDPANHRYLQAYEGLLWALMREHLDFHIVDTDILEEGTVGEGRVKVADVTAKAVVVPAMPIVEPPLAAWLTTYAAAGGPVVRCGLEEPAEAVVRRVREIVAPSLSVRVDDIEAGNILVVKRVGAGKVLWFGLNIGATPQTVSLDARTPLREEPLGGVARLQVHGGDYRRTIAPFEAFLVEAVCPRISASPAPTLPVVTVPVSGPARVTSLGANLMRLGTWSLSLLQPDGTYGPAATVAAVPLANQLSDTGLAFAPRFTHTFGHVPELSLPMIAARYEVRFDSSFDGPVELVMEPGSIVGDWAIDVNDRLRLTSGGFAPTRAHVRGSLGAEISDALVHGGNTLVVTVTTDRLDGGLLNPLYLAGLFGVTLAPLGLVAPGVEGQFEDYVGNRLPFYAGALEYETAFDLPSVPTGEQVVLAIVYSGPFHEATEVSVNGSAYQCVLWAPRQIIVPAALLRAGANRLCTRVHTTLIRSFEGQWFDYTAHRYREVEVGAGELIRTGH